MLTQLKKSGLKSKEAFRMPNGAFEPLKWNKKAVKKGA